MPPIIDQEWSILGTTSQVLESEELAKKVVEFSELAFYDEEHEGRYMCYVLDYWHHDTAIDSFRCLLKRNNIPNSVILVKQ